ncbi:hypothetical protein VCHA34P129_40194 [Vibrio chagasii]|nr:hypothetical protein VCHA34P129_40194 [Vibrio chagasii]
MSCIRITAIYAPFAIPHSNIYCIAITRRFLATERELAGIRLERANFNIGLERK